MDGPGLSRARPVGRRHPARGGVHLRPRLRDSEDERLATPAARSPRREAYDADITYGTNNEFGFDYLRDNMVCRSSRWCSATSHYAIVDEVDNILIDEARTPLIISGQAEEATDHYYQFAQIVQQLRDGTRLRGRPEAQVASP